MKALVMKNPGSLVLEERPRPVPKDGQMLCRVLSAGICGTDLHAFEGKQPFFTYPRVTGHELAVRIEEIPASAKNAAGNLREGDVVSVLPYLSCGTCMACRAGKTNCCAELKCLGVHTDGGMQEYIALPPYYAVPAGKVPPRDIAVVECFSIGFHGVRRANPAPGTAALVAGAGPIGIAVCCVSRTKLLKIADQAIFYLANCQANLWFARMPDNRGFYGFSKGKSHKNLQVQQAPRDHTRPQGTGCKSYCS